MVGMVRTQKNDGKTNERNNNLLFFFSLSLADTFIHKHTGDFKTE